MTETIDRFTTDKDPAIAGQDLEICFDNPDLSGQTITVEISNGEGSSDSIKITLDENGHGCATWSVPATGWDVIRLANPSSLQHTLHVVEAGDS